MSDQTMMKNFLILLALPIILASCQRSRPKVDVDEYLGFSLNQVQAALKAQTNFSQLPRYIKPGEQAWSCTGVTGWTSGFWPGILWYLYENTGDPQLKTIAHERTIPLEGIRNWRSKGHDIGFMTFCSFGNGYRLTGNPEYKKFLLEMADSLAVLYNPNVGTILSWPGRRKIGNIETSGTMVHNTIIDNMMNLELLFWASKNGGTKKLYDIAVSHARTTMKNHLRPDYSSYHVVVYDSLTGEAGHKITHQGYADNSMWARGQAWGIYGFTVAYRETHLPEFLETAQKMAEIYIDRLPNDYVPYWDFDAPNIPDAKKDASAAAVTASALLELSTFVEDATLQSYYRKTAGKILSSLGKNYLSDGSNHAILWHSVGNMNSNSEVDVPIIYADYYFVEALMREKKLKKDPKAGFMTREKNS